MRSRYVLLTLSCVVGILSVVTSKVATLHDARLLPGLLLVLIVPGFALVTAVVPQRHHTYAEYLLASVGASIAISTVAAVAVAAAPVGLTRLSFSIVLGSCTLILSVIAAVRTHNSAKRKCARGMSSEADL
jgi:uncharacterized membrane protein